MAAVADITKGFAEEVSFADTPDVFGRGARYAVGGATDLAVTAGGAGDRAVTVAAGKAWGDAVIAVHSTETVLNATANSSGSTRWDTLVERRNWETNTATLTLLAGGTSQTLAPAVQLRNPTPTTGAGFTYADQPVALVPVANGAANITPGSIIDLRLWSGEGGGLVAAHVKARDYVTSVGTRVHINGVDHVRVLDGTGTPQWNEYNLGGIGGAVFDAAGNMTAGAVGRTFAPLPRAGIYSNYSPQYAGSLPGALHKVDGVAFGTKPYARIATVRWSGAVETNGSGVRRAFIEQVNPSDPETGAGLVLESFEFEGGGGDTIPINLSTAMFIGAGQAVGVRCWVRRVTGTASAVYVDTPGRALWASWTEMPTGNDW